MQPKDKEEWKERWYEQARRRIADEFAKHKEIAWQNIAANKLIGLVDEIRAQAVAEERKRLLDQINSQDFQAKNADTLDMEKESWEAILEDLVGNAYEIGHAHASNAFATTPRMVDVGWGKVATNVKTVFRQAIAEAIQAERSRIMEAWPKDRSEPCGSWENDCGYCIPCGEHHDGIGAEEWNAALAEARDVVMPKK